MEIPSLIVIVVVSRTVSHDGATLEIVFHTRVGGGGGGGDRLCYYDYCRYYLIDAMCTVNSFGGTSSVSGAFGRRRRLIAK